MDDVFKKGLWVQNLGEENKVFSSLLISVWKMLSSYYLLKYEKGSLDPQKQCKCFMALATSLQFQLLKEEPRDS